MSTPRRRLALLAGALTAALALSACGGGSTPAAPATTAASGDRTLVVYSGREEALVGELIKQFEQTSGIKVETRYGSTTELAAQLLEEGDRTPAQVFLSQESGALGAVAAAGHLTTLPADVTSAVPANYTSKDGSWVGLTGRARVIAYDSRTYAADQVPGDITELVQPQWKGKIAIAPTNASFQAHVTALRVTAGEEAARAWVQGLKANEPQIHRNNTAILEAVNAGTAGLGLINHYYWARSETDPTTLRAQLKFGDPGSVSALVNVTGAGILKGAAQSPEAAEFVKFLVSPQAQKYFAEKTAEYPLVAGAGAPKAVPPLDRLGGPDIDLAQLSSVRTTVEMLTQEGLV
ncbi:iron ABC transporter substrate-binding protein [Pseudonocardia benzenivorans]|jgi:iron(III) transport system substrate-binding protein|uniref:Extracellular solute-binding protein family 1 n=2 Tax=Pseudonocardia TaxID=1847 RepID=F4CXS2_PSEUX|nr:iron ABC transporter substrate-binding protein [Pseudonocardia dioxanivorans]AEA28728.1 extracellular solute-binding protein family 1 [Pseudonocardia dioxanivorans CB1190]GJF01735.1 iron ABC transporter substrate-binding protein [Pseudonocardia sp. D17]